MYCSCTHLTDFAVLLNEAEVRNQLPAGCEDDNEDLTRLSQSVTYRIFGLLYLAVFLFSSIQLTRIVHYDGCVKPVTLMVHSLVAIICCCRILSMISYVFATSLNFWVIALLAGLPYAFIFELYSLIIYAWASFYSFAANVDHSNSRTKLKGLCVSVNFVLVMAVSVRCVLLCVPSHSIFVSFFLHRLPIHPIRSPVCYFEHSRCVSCDRSLLDCRFRLAPCRRNCHQNRFLCYWWSFAALGPDLLRVGYFADPHPVGS